MAQEKQLLIQDLCARLPYRVIVDYAHNAFKVYKGHYGHYVEHGTKRILTCDLLDVFISPRQNEKGEFIKPYLRPLSSMTEEEYDDMFNQLYLAQVEFFNNCSNTDTIGKLIANDMVRYDWLNKKMFDYRGLIPKGLANVATEGMYKL